jgi:peptidoglycan/xylan/chitin deacetylase (PgdA/CDA1 family)
MRFGIQKQVLIVGLHRVGYPVAGCTHRNLFTSPRFLRFQISLLKRLGFDFVTLKQAMQSRSGRFAVLTFDDGYLDTMTEAAPILERMSVPATVFVVTGDVGRSAMVWEEAGEKLPADLMCWETLRELRGRGWEIGSHASQHIHLDRYSRRAQMATVAESIDSIRDNIGEAPHSFCYPYGAYNAMTKEVLEQAGLSYGLTSEMAVFSDTTTSADNLALKRVPAGGRKPHHYLRFAARSIRAAGGYTALLPGGRSAAVTLSISPGSSLNGLLRAAMLDDAVPSDAPPAG